MGFPAESLKNIVIVKESSKLIPIFSDDIDKYPEATLVDNLHVELAKTAERNIRQLRERILALLPSEVEVQPFESAKLSPLPAIGFDRFDIINDNHDLLTLESKLKGVHWLALLDLDNTLYEAKSKNTIMLHHFAKFLRDKHNNVFHKGHGSLSDLDALIEYCDDWENQRERISDNLKIDDRIIEYEEGIERSGVLSAAAFKGLHIKELRKYGKEFIEHDLLKDGKFCEFTPAVIQKLRDHGILPVIITGAPDFLLPAILQKIGIAHGNGTTYKLNQHGNLTGKIDINLGTAEAKGHHGESLTEKDYAIALAMGDSIGDMGPISCAVFTTLNKQDVHGGAVICNATEATKKELKRTYKNRIKEERVQVVETEKGPLAIQAAVGIVLQKLFEPLHDFAKIKGDTEHPERLEAYLKYLAEIDEQSVNGESKTDRESNDSQVDEAHDNLSTLVALFEGSHPFNGNKKIKRYKHLKNLENIKRIRNVLREEGLNERQITTELSKFFPKIVVEAVMKSYMLDTRNESDIEDFIQSTEHLIDTRNMKDIHTFLEWIEASEATRLEVLTKLSAIKERYAISRPIIKRRSTYPPSANTLPEELVIEITREDSLESSPDNEEGEDYEVPEEISGTDKK